MSTEDGLSLRTILFIPDCSMRDVVTPISKSHRELRVRYIKQIAPITTNPSNSRELPNPHSRPFLYTIRNRKGRKRTIEETSETIKFVTGGCANMQSENYPARSMLAAMVSR